MRTYKSARAHVRTHSRTHAHARARRLCESLEYACLLDRLPSEPDSLDRLMLVAVWNLTCYNSLVGVLWWL